MFVSVIIPSYNHAPYLQQRIESVLNQSFQNFEVIILDDKSPDESDKILEQYKNHPKVTHCIINEQNSGSTFAQWNKGLALAKGDLIWIAESDDVADQEFLATLVPQFNKNQNLVLAYSQSYKMSSTGEITGTWQDQTDQFDREQFSHDFSINGLQYIEKFLCHKNTIPNASAVLFKKQTYFTVGGANPALKYIGDWEIWTKIVSQGDIFFCTKPLNYFRYHDNSVISRATKDPVNMLNILQQHILFCKTTAQFIANQPQNKITISILAKINFKIMRYYKNLLRLYCKQNNITAAKEILCEFREKQTSIAYLFILFKYSTYRIRFR